MLSIPFLNEEALHREIQRQWDILPLEQQHFVCELYKMMHLFDPWHSEHTSFLLEILLAHWNDEHFRKRIFSRPSVATDPEKRGPW
jgi:hypothetical protein